MLDEPNSNLDEVGERALGVALQKIKETGATVFIISTARTFFRGWIGVMILNAGVITLYGVREQVIAELAQQQAKAQQRVAPAPAAPAAPRTQVAPLTTDGSQPSA